MSGPEDSRFFFLLGIQRRSEGVGAGMNKTPGLDLMSAGFD